MRYLGSLLSLLSGFCMAANALALDITLDPSQPGHTFEGLGAVSAGASSRLLSDYPEPQRSQILDYLFKPNYGAALQHLKVEIGGEVNSTDGTEPTHRRTRTDQNYTRGYEWGLLQQAKARNPGLRLDCLAWGAPGWIGAGNYYSQDMCDYLVSFLKGAQTQYGLAFDFTGTHNEAAVNAAWIKQLRSTLDANGLQKVLLVAADEWGGAWNIVTNASYGILVDPALSNAVARIGAHYPQAASPAAAQACRQPLWASEDGIGGSSWAAARKLGKLFNRNYVTGRMTQTEIWSPLTSYYDILPAANSGLMRANTPWSGHYQVAPAIWVVAHTAQFAFPGWTYLEGGASALLPAGGSIVTLESTNHSDYSLVLETFDATAAQTITFHLTNGLSLAPLNLWQSSPTNQFIPLGQLTPAQGSFTYTFQPECLYTLTTTRGQAKGGAVPPPAAPFPLPFTEDFESYALGQTPKYFSDQAGTFETFLRADGQGQCLRQVLPQPGIRWAAEWNPYTLIGEATWADYDVSADVLIETNGGFAFVMGRVGSVRGFSDALPRGYWLALNNATAQWEFHASSNLLATGTAVIPTNSWHNLRLAMQGSSLRCYVDGTLATNVTDYTYSRGLAAVGCGWHGAQFDNFTVRQGPRAGLDLAPAAKASPATYLREISALLARKWPANRTVTIVCHGHSVPAGYFKTPVVDSFNAYPHLLHQALKQRFPYAVLNVTVTGIGGENSESGAKRFERDVLALHPDVVTIDYALNDRAIGLSRAEAAWRSMIESALQRHLKVILLTPTPDLSAKLNDPADPLNQQAEQIRRLAAEYGLGLADSLARFKACVASGGRLQDLMAQSNHPNRKGHDLVLAELLSWFP